MIDNYSNRIDGLVTLLHGSSAVMSILSEATLAQLLINSHNNLQKIQNKQQ